MNFSDNPNEDKMSSMEKGKKGSPTRNEGFKCRAFAVIAVSFLVGSLVGGGFVLLLRDDNVSENASDNNETKVEAGYGTCAPESVELSKYKQWQEEEGFWLGELSLYNSNGDASSSASWNYKYDHYKGFITGNVEGNGYRQRNVFMYPPQDIENCPHANSTGSKDGSSPVGVGTCGINGNMKVFWADQNATTCSLNPELGGTIEGPYGSLQYTYTTLVGNDNAVLYQVYMTKSALNNYEMFVLQNPYNRCTMAADGPYCGYDDDRLMQSQLTTLTKLPSGQVLRTRTAQGFDAFGNVGATTYSSYYRERKVSEEEFWQEFTATKAAYNILESDECAWKSGETGGNQLSGYTPGFPACKKHLEESFKL